MTDLKEHKVLHQVAHVIMATINMMLVTTSTTLMMMMVNDDADDDHEFPNRRHVHRLLHLPGNEISEVSSRCPNYRRL